MHGFEWYPEYISSLRSQGSTQEQGLWTTTTVGRLAVYESTMKNRQHAASFTAQSLPASIAAGWGSPFQPWSWGHRERLLHSMFAVERFRFALCGYTIFPFFWIPPFFSRNLSCGRKPASKPASKQATKGGQPASKHASKHASTQASKQARKGAREGASRIQPEINTLNLR